MRSQNRTKVAIFSQTILSLIILSVVWLDEFIDMPHFLFGAPATLYKLQEHIIETIAIALAAGSSIAVTTISLGGLDRAKHFLGVCAWCEKVCIDAQWIVFEQCLARDQAKNRTCDGARWRPMR